MSFWSRFFNCRRKEKELEDEINAHLAMEAEQRMDWESHRSKRLECAARSRKCCIGEEVTRGVTGWMAGTSAAGLAFSVRRQIPWFCAGHDSFARVRDRANTAFLLSSSAAPAASGEGPGPVGSGAKGWGSGGVR
jgi:hypothetical protein